MSQAGNVASGESPAPAPAATEGMNTQQAAFMVGDQAAGTISGEIVVVAEQPGRMVNEPLSLSGVFLAEFIGPGQLSLDLEFDSPAVLDIPRPQEPWLRLGLMLELGTGLWAYGQYRYELTAFGPVILELWAGAWVPVWPFKLSDTRIAAGIEAAVGK
ncbi:MAG: hypothetical protein ACM3X6_01355 [Patescibacteria group bacterium]